MTKPSLAPLSTRISEFQYWVQRTMPMVYDDSLSYMELLHKVVEHLNKIGELTNELTELWNEINDWILNDGVKEAVEDYLDILVSNGTMATIINEEIFAELNDDIRGRGINIMRLGAIGNGVADDSDLIIQALADYDHVRIPKGRMMGITKTIFVPNGKSLEGMVMNVRGYQDTPSLKWIGVTDNRKAMVVMGTNDVGAEPTVDASNVIIRNLYLDGDKKVGVGIYGTYITNESLVDNIVIRNTLEYNGYFARSWYATFTNITSLACKGKGLAFGMPLIWQNGVRVDWLTSSPLEMNNTKIDNIRSHTSGEFYSVDNPSTFDPTNNVQNIHGYGLGIGYGNSLHVTNFLSERSGGVNLYVLTGSQPVKTIEKGYLESTNYYSAQTDTTRCNMIIEHDSPTGGTYEISNVFMNFYSGGIYHKGVLGRKVKLTNIHQPRFLKSLDGLTAFQIYAEVIKTNVYSDCGLYNTSEEYASGTEIIQTVNTRYSFTVNTRPSKHFKLIYVKALSGVVPDGGFQFNYDDGTTATRSFPTLTTSWQLATVANANLVSITKTGVSGAVDQNVDFKVVNTPPTYL